MGMRWIAIFFGPHAPEAQTSRLSLFSHYFKGLERFLKLATSSSQAIDFPKPALRILPPKPNFATEPDELQFDTHTGASPGSSER
jgi:hypothetical protein